MSITIDFYEKLGIPKMINAAGTYTIIGGSRMTEETLEAMRLAAHHFVDMRELQRKVHMRLAEITRNEAAYVATGAAAALYLATGAAITLKIGRPFVYLDREDIRKSEVIIQRSHRNPYDWGIRQLGVKLVEIGYPNVIQPTSEDDLKYAINENTVAIFYAAMPNGGWTAPGELELGKTLEIAQESNVPVIVDAAAQLPPVENLWNFTNAGASAAVFSGGKDLRGPQASGLIVGEKRLLEKIEQTGFPNYGIGRMLKVGREEMCGLVAAVEQYVVMDHDKRRQKCEREVKETIDFFVDFENVTAKRSFPNEAGQPIPQALVTIDSDIKNSSRLVSEKLRSGSPAVAIAIYDENSFFVNPMTLDDGELSIVLQRLKYVLLELGLS